MTKNKKAGKAKEALFDQIRQRGPVSVAIKEVPRKKEGRDGLMEQIRSSHTSSREIQKYECFQCGFKFLRDLSKERADKTCSKCHTGVCGPRGSAPPERKAGARQAMGDKSALAPSPGASLEKRSGKCAKNNGPHVVRQCMQSIDTCLC